MPTVISSHEGGKMEPNYYPGKQEVGASLGENGGPAIFFAVGVIDLPKLADLPFRASRIGRLHGHHWR